MKATWNYELSVTQMTDFLLSFKVIIMSHHEDLRGVEEKQFVLWFADYWHRMQDITLGSSFSRWMEPLLLFMLEAQALTVLFSFLAIFKLKPHLFLFSTVSNVASILFVWGVGSVSSPFYTTVGFEVGFWLSLVAFALFLASFILSSRWLKR